MTDPKRLLEQPGSDLDVLLLESALDEAPPSRAVDRTLVALGVGSAATGLAAGAATSTAATLKSGAAGGASGLGAAGWFGSLSLVGKLGVGIAFIGAAVGVPYAVTREPAAPPAPVAPVAPAGPVANVAPAHPGQPIEAQPGQGETSSPAAAAENAGAPSAALEEPVGRPAEAPPSEKAAPASPRKPSSEKSAAPVPTEKPAAASSLKDELRFLDAARSALQSGDKAARAHLDAYAARFPDGQLKAEAQAMRAVAKE